MDLRIEGQHRLTGLRDQPGLPGPAPRSAARLAAVQDAPDDQRPAARRKDDPLWRKNFSLWWMVFHAAAGRPWLDDRGRFGELPEFAAAQRHSPGDQERHEIGRAQV